MLSGAAAISFLVYRWRHSGFRWAAFGAALSDVDWRWMTVAIALIVFSYFGRALRWEIMLRPLCGRASLWRMFSATAIGFTAVVLFGRAGEPVRPYLIAKQHNVAFSSQVAAWLVERLLDLLMILLFFGVALTQVKHAALQPGPGLAIAFQAAGYIAGVAGLTAFSLLIGMRQLEGQVRERLTAALSFLPELALARVGRFLEAFEEGMHATRNGVFASVLVLLTVTEWAVVATAFACVLRAFPATHAMGVTDIAILLGFVCFGGIIQIPGVGGGTQIVSVIVLTELFGLGIEAASGVALVLWLVTYVSVVPLGLALAFHDGLRWRNLRQIDAMSEGVT